MARYIVYQTREGREQLFRLDTVEDEQHERATADRELHSRDTSVVGYHFENLSPDEARERGATQ